MSSSIVFSMLPERRSTEDAFYANHLLIKHAVVWSKDGLDELKKLDIPVHERIILDCERTQIKLGRLRTSVTDKRPEYPRYRFDEKLREHIENRSDVSVRFIPPIADVYAKEGLPPARSFDKLSGGEQRAIKEMGLTEQVRKTETVQVIVKPKKKTDLHVGNG